MSKKTKATDPARFQGNGISYRAKIIGVEDVPEARGDKMCQEMIQKLKNSVKISGQHKQRVFINVTLEGLKIIDGANMNVLHTHPVHQISFISRDVTDSRAFGYIFGPGDGTHKFFAIKTANAAENLVLTLRDLFQTVYEMKKQEIEEAKAKAAGTEGEGENAPAEGQTPEGQESIYQVPKNNAPVNPQEQEEAVANLLDLEDQVDNILKGIEQIKNLEFDELSQDEAPRQPVSPTTSTSPTSPAAPPTSDPWGVSAAAAPAAAATAPVATSSIPASSSLNDLEGLVSSPPPTSNPFGGIPFPGGPATSMGVTAPGFGAMGQPAMFGMPGQQPGVQVSRDPFGTHPFSQQVRPQQVPQMMAGPGAAPFGQQPGFGAPFVAPRASPTPGNPFPGAMGAPGVAGMQPSFGMGTPAMPPFGLATPAASMGMQMQPPGAAGANLFGQQPEENLLQPQKPGGQEEAQPKAEPRPALFGDLVDIKKSASTESAAKSPKEMFKELAQPPKKSLNEIKAGGTPPPKQSASPFGDSFFGAPVNGKPSDAQS